MEGFRFEGFKEGFIWDSTLQFSGNDPSISEENYGRTHNAVGKEGPR